MMKNENIMELLPSSTITSLNCVYFLSVVGKTSARVNSIVTSSRFEFSSKSFPLHDIEEWFFRSIFELCAHLCGPAGVHSVVI